MRRALELAEHGRGHVEPNPLVGAVVVRDGQIVGEGWHQRYGEAHAEVNALVAAGEAARGATVYVALEPCCHHGKTPPCTDALLRAGVGRVVAAMCDPFPQVAGHGAAQLRAAGVDVEVGVLEAEARRLNAPYLKLLATHRPYVHAKWAMSLDGKIATRSGDSKWISNESSRQRVHELRGRMDAIVAGIGTVLADDPLLTARPPGPRKPTRVVLDHRGRLPPTSRLVQSVAEAPLLIVTHPLGESVRRRLELQGAEVFEVAPEDGMTTVSALLEELGRRRMTNILIEGGGEVLGSFLDAAAVDEVHVFIAPLLIGGAAAKSPLGGRGADTLASAFRLDAWCAERIGGDLYWHGWRGNGDNFR
ncbi:MAG: bifunctional diaminohydroxyphosphoribosylaminopyrimidine deaminase/5-amino-6-(5-phosphoribosylamino)uracil reductase RibD [Gemmataceae bacterium]|nr:bifunctional diaminohydroxyphosphoribosylaminopyrimidine deaminase/5-amino-6-(5-phosphoribosylamino)uracil reductase RibD [Gemmataceae bacterium]